MNDTYEDITSTVQVNPSGSLLYAEDKVVAECYPCWGFRFVLRNGQVRLERRRTEAA